jgi:hypothetical protein
LAEYFDILRNNNPGVYIEERDNSLYNITPDFEQINLVIGSSKEGPVNLPVLVISPENFQEIYGEIDYSLERKNSFFHRTVLNALRESPVICLNIRAFDDELDKYNWISLSTTSNHLNTNVRSNGISLFYDTQDGFFRRDTDRLINVVKNSSGVYNTPITFVNMGYKTITLFAFKSNVSGFDIPVEDWYKNIPEYLHPKDLISDYMIDVIALEGDWTKYKQLSIDPKWSQYFRDNGLIIDRLNEFLNESEVNVARKWTGSLIPYFVDKNNKNAFLPNIINEDINETGIMVSYDLDLIETEFRNGTIDLLGGELINSSNQMIDFLSYKRDIQDYLFIHEKVLDQPGNSFGNPNFNLGGGRTQIYSEGYVNDCKLKNTIISSTTKLESLPLEVGKDAYVVINSKKINLSSVESEILDLYAILDTNQHFPFIIAVNDEQGVFYIKGETMSINNPVVLPEIDFTTTLVLGYYIISCSVENVFESELFGVTIDNNGFINPFVTTSTSDYQITFDTSPYLYQQILRFKNINILNSRNYFQGRIFHLWYWLNLNIAQNQSIIIDTNNNKQLLRFVEIFNDNNDKIVRLTVNDIASNIQSVDDISGHFGLYIKDLEFITQSEDKWRTQIEPFIEGEFGIIGENSEIYEAYFRGDINSGDPFFWSLATEQNIEFIHDINTNYIIFKEGSYYTDYLFKKIIVNGTRLNDGIYRILSETVYNGYYTLIVEEDVIDEIVLQQVSFFDANDAKVINIYQLGGRLKVKVDVYQGDLENLYDKVFGKDSDTQWRKTIQIEEILDKNTILINFNQYNNILKLGNYLLGDNKLLTNNIGERRRNITRIVELVRYDINSNYLLVRCDAPIKIEEIVPGLLQTKYFLPISEWIDTLDGKLLKKFTIRLETLPDGSDERLNQLLDMVNRNTKMAKSLTSSNMEWRYLIDSYGGGNLSNSKHQLADLCGVKQLAFGFLNMPSVKQFLNSTSTQFTTNGRFDTKLLLNGGNRIISGGLKFSLTQTSKSHVTYLFPNVMIQDNGRYVSVPPASYVSNLYMQKFNNPQFNPLNVMAGIEYGRLRTINGLEEIFDDEQLKDLNALRITPIASFQNTFFYLYSENTAESERSAITSIKIRETLIELESELKNMLYTFQWNFYLENIGDDILKEANNICGSYKRLSAISEFRNEFIRTNELVDAQIGVLKTYIEPVQNMRTIILQINVFRTGAISEISR